MKALRVLAALACASIVLVLALGVLTSLSVVMTSGYTFCSPGGAPAEVRCGGGGARQVYNGLIGIILNGGFAALFAWLGLSAWKGHFVRRFSTPAEAAQ